MLIHINQLEIHESRLGTYLTEIEIHAEKSDCDMIGIEWVQGGYHGYIMGIINKRLPSKLSRIKMISPSPKDFSPWDEGPLHKFGPGPSGGELRPARRPELRAVSRWVCTGETSGIWEEKPCDNCEKALVPVRKLQWRGRVGGCEDLGQWIRSDTWTPQPKLLGSIGRYPRPLWVETFDYTPASVMS